MSALNGDRARFHKDRQRKLRRRQGIRSMVARLEEQKALNQLQRPAMQLPIPHPERISEAAPHMIGDDTTRVRS